MPNALHYRRLENMHHAANCNVAYCKGIRLTVGEGVAEITLPLRPEFFHAAKAVHGFLYFKMLDEAAFFAANSLVEDAFVLTTDFHMNLLRPVTSGEIRAEGKVAHQSKSLILAEAVLYNAEGKQLARGSGSFVKGPTPLNADIGYKD
jgi:uncharacterized protein (TIGR00369 family)